MNYLYLRKYKKYKKKYLDLKKNMGGVKRTPLKLGQNSKTHYIQINENITIKTVKYNIGYYLYNASRSNNLDWGDDTNQKSLWFGLKEEDIKNYGNYIHTLIINDNELTIMDLEDTDTYNFVHSLLNDDNIKRHLQNSWGDKTRKTSRESDYPVINYLSNLDILYNKFSIDGIGTGRGLPYIDAPRGHHAELCVFYRSRYKLKEIKIEKIEDLNVAQNSIALEMKNNRQQLILKKRSERRVYLENLKKTKKENKKRSLMLENSDDKNKDKFFSIKRINLDNLGDKFDLEDIL
jgi:hypothetical protein